ncbi:MAG: GNAT family N-acetyltransferase [Actinobacteria bacterium]|jgi:GNAT superfamily N-acetyltransferase|nr:GNAT family N-acetyltransferase [Actinomycetota bacterium]
MAVEIRRARVADAEDYSKIRLEALRVAPAAFGSVHEDVAKFPTSRFEEQLRNGCYFLAYESGKVIGTSSYAQFSLNRRRHAGLYGMFVTPRWQGQGVAAELVNAVRQQARLGGYRELYLSVNPSMVRAVAFYEREGFRDTGEREPMRRDPSIALMTMKAAVEG